METVALKGKRVGGVEAEGEWRRVGGEDGEWGEESWERYRDSLGEKVSGSHWISVGRGAGSPEKGSACGGAAGNSKTITQKHLVYFSSFIPCIFACLPTARVGLVCDRELKDARICESAFGLILVMRWLHKNDAKANKGSTNSCEAHCSDT